MTSHDWSEKDAPWEDISNAAEYIGTTLNKYGLHVSDYKEKWGQVRVYVMFGPTANWTYYPYLWRVAYLLSYIVHPYQVWLYKTVYKRALKKWPHLAGEILCGADHTELLVGLDPRLIREKDPEGYTRIRWVENENKKS